MSKILAAVSLLLVTAGSAFGATADFIFLNKLALLMAINAVLGVMVAFCAFVIASHLWEKIRGRRPSPVRVPAGRQKRRPSRNFRTGDASRNPEAINQ